jgi:hypothetical protein
MLKKLMMYRDISDKMSIDHDFRKEFFMSSFWKYREKTRLSEATGIPRQQLSDILHRRRGCSPARAKVLADATRIHLGKIISWQCWLFNRSTEHPAFYGSPVYKIS